MAKSPAKSAADLTAEFTKLREAEEAARKKIEAKKARLALKLLALQSPPPASEDAVAKALESQARANEAAIAALKEEHAAALAKASLPLEKRIDLALAHGLRETLAGRIGLDVVPSIRAAIAKVPTGENAESAEIKSAALKFLDSLPPAPPPTRPIPVDSSKPLASAPDPNRTLQTLNPTQALPRGS